MRKQLRCQAELEAISYPRKGERRVRYATCEFPIDEDTCNWFAFPRWETLVDNWFEEVIVLRKVDVPMCPSCALTFAFEIDEEETFAWLAEAGKVVRHHKATAWNI